MKYAFSLSIVCIAMFALAACGGRSAEDPVAPAPPPPAETETPIDTEAIGEAVEEAAEEMAAYATEAAEAVEEAIEELIESVEFDGPVIAGTSWQVGEYELHFKDVDEVIDGAAHGKVQVKGGDVAFLPDGMEMDYILGADGRIDILTPRDDYSGTFDGETLILSGMEAQPISQ